MQKIENNENVWERTRDESPEALCLPELLSLLYWRMWGLSASGFSVVIDIQTHVARSWLYRGGISVFSIWVLSRFYLSSVAILSEFYRGFFWRNFKNSKWAIFAEDKVQFRINNTKDVSKIQHQQFSQETKSGFNEIYGLLQKHRSSTRKTFVFLCKASRSVCCFQFSYNLTIWVHSENMRIFPLVRTRHAWR